MEIPPIEYKDIELLLREIEKCKENPTEVFYTGYAIECLAKEIRELRKSIDNIHDNVTELDNRTYQRE
jgi:uncharacterized protein YoaH (UPF0181 family)